MRPRLGEVRLGWLVPVLASIVLAIVLTVLKITDVYWGIAAGLALELIAVLHTTLRRLTSIEKMLGQVRSLPKIQGIIDNIQDITTKPSRFKSLLLDQEVDIFDAMIDQLGRGRQSVSVDHFMRLAEVIYGELKRHDTLYATSVFGGGEYWSTRFGQRYAELNKSAARRGVKIVRTYILRDSAQLAEKAAIMQTQAGFSDVRVVMLADVPIGDNELRDFLVVDLEIAAEFHFATNNVITHIDVVSDRGEVTELSRTMERILHASVPLKDALGGKPELQLIRPPGDA